MSIAASRARIAHIAASPLLPIWALLALLPFGRSAEVAVLLALAGCVFLFAREPRALTGHPGARLLVLMWACYAGAALLSALDAVNPGKSWSTVVAVLRFLPLGVYMAFALRRRSVWHELQTGIALIVALWLVDAWVQALTGWSLGGAPESERLAGVFGADNLKFGPVLATLSPFLLLEIRRRWGLRGLIAGLLLVLGPMLLAGSRASWLAFAVVALVFLWREARHPMQFAMWTVGVGISALLAVLVARHGSDAFDARMDRTLLALQGTSTGVDAALAGRLQIWHTAQSMIAAHPVNGVGVRGFRYAYAAYAAPGDTFVQADGSGAAHAHQWLLEVLSETGVLGLCLWLFAIGLGMRAWRQASRHARDAAFTPALALVAMAFPLNTHLAFYSAWWGLLFWWLIGLYCAALYLVEDSAHA